jgi:uncharacterized iron-regulated membrane protein
MQEMLLPPEFSQYIPDVLEAHAEMIAHALIALPMAALFATALAFRPRRRGTPARSGPVIQTQILLAMVSAVIMLIVGSSLARAFGTAGVASLVRYRTNIDDPKDAVVMLATLSIGLAAGVGLYGLAAFATVFMLGVLWVVESLEPERRTTFDLKVSAGDPATVREGIEGILRRYDIKYELRATSPKELTYETTVPYSTRTGRITNAILKLQQGDGDVEVSWEEKPKK